jgi:streptomycin 6-kinase
MSEHLNHYLHAWNLSDPQPLAQTPTSHVYTVTSADGTTVILKLLTPFGHEERNGAAALRCFDGRGAVRLLRQDDHAHLLEYADGQDLIGLVKSGDDEKAALIIAGVLNQLHSVSVRPFPHELVPLRRWFCSLFHKAQADQRLGLNSIYIRAATIAETLLAEPLDVCVLHGDIHHENIRQSRRGWLAFDPKGLVGERTFDAANALCNPLNMPERVHNEARLLKNAGILAQMMRLPRARILSYVFAYSGLSASWLLDDGLDPAYTLRVAEIVEPHLAG